MKRPLLFDTCILIDILKNRAEAVSLFEDMSVASAISVITIQEILTGIRAGESAAFEDLLVSFEKISVDIEIARTSGSIMRRYRKSHGLDSNDAVIAATAQIGDYDLITLNLKHFPMFPDLKRPY